MPQRIKSPDNRKSNRIPKLLPLLGESFDFQQSTPTHEPLRNPGSASVPLASFNSIPLTNIPLPLFVLSGSVSAPVLKSDDQIHNLNLPAHQNIRPCPTRFIQAPPAIPL
jgi:hypothetical protein